MEINKTEVENIFKIFDKTQDELVNSIKSLNKNYSYSTQWDDYESRESAKNDIKKLFMDYFETKLNNS